MRDTQQILVGSAKACGYRSVEWNEFVQVVELPGRPDGEIIWDPINLPHQAMLLSSRLHINLDYREGYVDAFTESGQHYAVEEFKLHGGNKLKAACLAISRCASEIV